MCLSLKYDINGFLIVKCTTANINDDENSLLEINFHLS